MTQQWIIFFGIIVTTVIEKSHELIIIVMLKWIVGMTMTLYARESSSHQHFPGRVHAIDHGSRSEFFVVGSAFIIGHGIAMKCSGDILRIRRIGKKITGNLLCQETIIRHIAVECIDRPVAVTPDGAAVIALISFGVCITGEVEPQG